MRRISARLAVVLLVVLGVVGACASLASATKPDPDHKVTICHATASATNPYVVITVDIAGIVGGSGHGSSGVNAGDIIPPFTMDGFVYYGHNWDTAHYPTAGCNIPGVTPPTDNNTNF